MSKVLIVEDDQTIRKTLAKRLTKLGHEIIEAEDGSIGITQTNEQKPDLILLDMIMPNKSGFEVLEELKIKQNLATPILVITNLDQKNDVETAKKLGAADYITKSNISLQDLAIKINKHLTTQ